MNEKRIEELRVLRRNWAVGSGELRNALDEALDEVEQLRKALTGTLDHWQGCVVGTLALYALNDEHITDAVLKLMPCGNGPLERFAKSLLAGEPAVRLKGPACPE